MKVINLEEKLSLFGDYWSPRILAECNGNYIKIAKVKGEFVWHDHRDEDEVFLVLKGVLYIDFDGVSVELNSGEMAVVPRGKRHRTRSGSEECHIMLFEPKSTRHTGEVQSDLTQSGEIFI